MHEQRMDSRLQREGGTRQGFLGVSSLAVVIPERQRGGRAQAYGLLVSQVAAHSPAGDRLGLRLGVIEI